MVPQLVKASESRVELFIYLVALVYPVNLLSSCTAQPPQEWCLKKPTRHVYKGDKLLGTLDGSPWFTMVHRLVTRIRS